MSRTSGSIFYELYAGYFVHDAEDSASYNLL